MSGWQDVSTAPKDRHLLLCGQQIPDNSGVRFGGVIVTSGYWDGIDSSWCMTGSTWQGPFIEPTHWMPLPEPPTPTTGDHHDR